MAVPGQCEVLVVGAGPVGLAIANLLGLHGVDALVVDRAPAIQTHPRAIALDNEALRILQYAGIRAEADFAIVPIPEVRMLSPFFGCFVRMKTAGLRDGHPQLVTFFQPELESALERALERHASVRLHRGVECLALADAEGGIVAELQEGTGDPARVRARFVVAADGASSAIRHRLGIDFEGESYAEDWLIVDALDAPRPVREISFHCDPVRPAPHMPAPGGRQRWEFMLHPGESREAMLEPSRIHDVLRPWTGGVPLPIERSAIYRFHARVLSRFSAGRVFFAGDAAHLTPPFAGQGLVAGLRDAANLAWKLAWVLRGQAGEEILASYDTERRPHARAMIGLARLMGRLVMPRNRLVALLLHGIARLVSLTPGLKTHVEELGLKPQNRFRRGLFAPRRRGAPVERGNHFPQALLRGTTGEVRPGDLALGPRLLLLGLGVDPCAHLDEASRARWQALGGELACILPATAGGVVPAWRDAERVYLRALPPGGWLVVLRPDKVVMLDGPPAEAAALVDGAERLLRGAVAA